MCVFMCLSACLCMHVCVRVEGKGGNGLKAVESQREGMIKRGKTAEINGLQDTD